MNCVTEEYSHAPEINYSTDDQERDIKCTRQDIMNYSPGIHMQQEKEKSILDDYDRYGGIEDVWYLILILTKNEITKGVSK